MTKSFVGDYLVNDRLYEAPVSCPYEVSAGRKGHGRPYITLGLVLPESPSETQVLTHARDIVVHVDTGADITSFTEAAAEHWQIDLEQYSPAEVEVLLLADGSVTMGVRRELDLAVGGRTVLRNVPVAFPLPSEKVMTEYLRTGLGPISRLSPMRIRENLFGVEGVLDQAMMCFDSDHLHVFRKQSGFRPRVVST